MKDTIRCPHCTMVVKLPNGNSDTYIDGLINSLLAAREEINAARKTGETKYASRKSMYSFLRAVGLNPAQTGHFTIECHPGDVVRAEFNVFLMPDQFALLAKVVEPELRRAAVFKIMNVENGEETSA